MKFSKIETEYLTHTAKASDLTRQLALVGFAVLWVLKEANSQAVIPEHLLPAAFLFALGLFCDLLQYLILAGTWTEEAFAAEQLVLARIAISRALDPANEEVAVGQKIHRLPRYLFWIKTRAVVAGYDWLLVALIYQILFWR